jgi:hypothetical protein
VEGVGGKNMTSNTPCTHYNHVAALPQLMCCPAVRARACLLLCCPCPHPSLPFAGRQKALVHSPTNFSISLMACLRMAAAQDMMSSSRSYNKHTCIMLPEVLAGRS